MRSAALEKILYFKNLQPFNVKRTKSTENVVVEMAVFPATTEVTSSSITLTTEGGTPNKAAAPNLSRKFAAGAVLRPDVAHTVTGVINEGAEDELKTGSTKLRPVELEFTATAEGVDQAFTDALPVTNLQPFVQLGAIPTPAPDASTVLISGRVVDALAPVMTVLIGSDVVSVIQTSAGVNDYGPFVGTFQKQVALPPQDVLFEATATNALGNSGSDSVWIRANVGTDGAIVARTVRQQQSVPVDEPSATSSTFYITATDLSGPPSSSVSVALATGERKIPVTRVGTGPAQSPGLLLVPEAFQMPSGISTTLRAKIEATRLRATLGERPVVSYLRPNIKDDGIASGIEFVGENGAPMRYVPGVTAAPTIQITTAVPVRVGDFWELVVAGTVLDPVRKANSAAPPPVVSINGVQAALTGGGDGRFGFTAPNQVALPLPTTRVSVRAENAIGAASYRTAFVTSQDGDGPIVNPPTVFFTNDTPVEVAKPFKVRFIGPRFAPAPTATVASNLSIEESVTRQVPMTGTELPGGVNHYQTEPILGSRIPWHRLADPISPSGLSASGAIPIEAGSAITALVQGGGSSFRRNAEVSGLEILTPREASIMNVLPTSPLTTLYVQGMVDTEPTQVPAGEYNDPHVVQTIRWHGLASKPTISVYQPDKDELEQSAQADLSPRLGNVNLRSKSRHDLLPAVLGQNIYSADGVDTEGNRFHSEAFTFAYLPGEHQNESSIGRDIADPGLFRLARGRYLVPDQPGVIDMAYPSVADTVISEFLRKNALRPLEFSRNQGTLLSVARSDGADVSEPLKEDLPGNYPPEQPDPAPFPEQVLDTEGDVIFQDVKDDPTLFARWMQSLDSPRDYIALLKRAQIIQQIRAKKGLPAMGSRVSLEYKVSHDKATKQFVLDVLPNVLDPFYAPLAKLFGFVATALNKAVLIGGTKFAGISILGAGATLKVTAAAAPVLPRLEPIVVGPAQLAQIDNLADDLSVAMSKRIAAARQFAVARQLRIGNVRSADELAAISKAQFASHALGEAAAEQVVRTHLLSPAERVTGTLRKVCCQQYPGSGGGANGLFDQVWIVNEGSAAERFIVMEAKGGKAVNPMNGRFASGRQVIDATTGAQSYAVQGSPEYFEDILQEMSKDADLVEVVAMLRAKIPIDGSPVVAIDYYLSSATWSRFSLPGVGRKTFQAADRAKLYKFKVTR